MAVESIFYSASGIELSRRTDLGGGRQGAATAVVDGAQLARRHQAGDRDRPDARAARAMSSSSPTCSAKAMARSAREDPMEFLRPFMSDVSGMRRRIAAALDTLTREADRRAIGDISRRAAIGFCFGGLNVLDLARTGADVQAVVSMHGTLATPQPAKRGDIKAAVLAVHGAADPVAPKAERDAFEAEMTEAGARWALLDVRRCRARLHRPAGQPCRTCTTSRPPATATRSRMPSSLMPSRAGCEAARSPH